jgi:tetratricopeptide (TPR) repeat protein
VAAMAPKPEPEPQVPDDIQVLLDEAWEFRNAGKYENAKTVLQQALTIADGCEHALARAATKYYSAIILHEWERNSAGAKELMRECLRQFQIVNAPKRVAMAFYQLGMFELDEGHLDQAEAYFYQSVEIDENNDHKRGVAATLLMLGWLEDHRGNFGKSLDFYDRVLRYWLSVYTEGDAEITKEAAQSIAGAYQHKGLVYENLGKVEDVESNYLRALEWHRKSVFKPDVGKILYLLARLKYREGQYNDGDQFLNEAVAIYENIGDVRLYALCLDLKARGLFTLGQREKATSVFELALAAVEKAHDYKEQVKFLKKLGHIFLKESDLEKAKDYFDQAVVISLRHGLLEGYADAVKGLAEIAQVENNSSERNRLLEIGIRTLEKHLASLEGEPRRAFTIGQIASFYESMEDFQRALVFYQRATKLFESIFEIGGVANCLGSIARINGILGKKGEEFETYRKLKQLVDGTRYYDLIAGAAINLGEINMQMGNLDEAKIMFEEADYLCRKFHLKYVAHLEKSMMRLSAEINTRKPSELNLNELIEELFALIEWFPEAKDNLLCLWIYGRDHDLYVNYRNRIGLKLMVCEDSVEKFVTVSGALHPYHELCLQVVNDEYQTGLNIVPFPIDKKMFFGNRYQPTSDVGTSKVTRNKGVVLVGWTPGLPPQANQLILSRSATDLIKQKIFFLPYERHLANDKLFSDIRFSKELGLIPVYCDVLPSSDNITTIHSATISLPVLSDLDVTTYRREIRAVKRVFNRLISITKTSALDILNELASEAEELADVNGKTGRIDLTVYVLQFPYALSTDVHVGLVVENS